MRIAAYETPSQRCNPIVFPKFRVGQGSGLIEHFFRCLHKFRDILISFVFVLIFNVIELFL